MIIPPQKLIDLGFGEDNIDCSGLKLTLAEVFVTASQGVLGVDERSLPEYRALEPGHDGYFYLDKGAYVIRYNEYVKIPRDTIALAIPRSSLLRMGVTLFTAVWDPGYEGRGYGLLLVENPHGVKLQKGVQVAQLVYIRMEEESMKPYRGVYYGER